MPPTFADISTFGKILICYRYRRYSKLTSVFRDTVKRGRKESLSDKKQIGCLADKKTQAVEVEATNCTSTNHRTTENKRQKKSGEQLSVWTVLINSKQKHRMGLS